MPNIGFIRPFESSFSRSNPSRWSLKFAYRVAGVNSRLTLKKRKQRPDGHDELPGSFGRDKVRLVCKPCESRRRRCVGRGSDASSTDRDSSFRLPQSQRASQSPGYSERRHELRLRAQAGALKLRQAERSIDLIIRDQNK